MTIVERGRLPVSERHSFFFGNYPTEPEIFNSNQAAIEARVKGNYRVRCGHCGVSLMGTTDGVGPVTEVIWRHDGDTYFGTFTIQQQHVDAKTT